MGLSYSYNLSGEIYMHNWTISLGDFSDVLKLMVYNL